MQAPGLSQYTTIRLYMYKHRCSIVNCPLPTPPPLHTGEVFLNFEFTSNCPDDMMNANLMIIHGCFWSIHQSDAKQPHRRFNWICPTHRKVLVINATQYIQSYQVGDPTQMDSIACSRASLTSTFFQGFPCFRSFLCSSVVNML